MRAGSFRWRTTASALIPSLPKGFSLFFSVCTRAKSAPPRGIGLAVCKRIVDATADTFPNRGEIEKVADLTDENAA